MTTIFGRFRQTVQVVFAWARPVQDDLARQYLSEAQFALYMTMSRSARQHHLRVTQALLREGHRQPVLLQAALLHDVGKTRYPFGLFAKILVVVVRAVAPTHFAKWGQGDPLTWRRPFVVSAQHPAWGAEMASEVGLDPISVALIRRHQDPLPKTPQDEVETWLNYLHMADDRS